MPPVLMIRGLSHPFNTLFGPGIALSPSPAHLNGGRGKDRPSLSVRIDGETWNTSAHTCLRPRRNLGTDYEKSTRKKTSSDCRGSSPIPSGRMTILLLEAAPRLAARLLDCLLDLEALLFFAITYLLQNS